MKSEDSKDERKHKEKHNGRLLSIAGGRVPRAGGLRT